VIFCTPDYFRSFSHHIHNYAAHNRSQHLFLHCSLHAVFLCGNTASYARADNTNDVPTRADVQSQLDTLNKQKDLTPQDKLVQQDLTETLETLDKIERIKAETAQLRQKVAQAPDNMRKATESLNALSDVDNDDETRKTLSTLSLRQLESRVAQLLDDLQTGSPIWQPTTASWFRCKPSRSACKTRCIRLPSSYSRSATV
jgi:potassium efflux system protein